MHEALSTQRRLRVSALGVLLLGGCLAAACGTPSAPKASSPDVWAVVGDVEIRRDEVESAYRRVVQPTPTPPSEEEIVAVKLGIVDELITQELMLARARAVGIDVTDAEVETAFTDRKRNMTEEAFQKELGQRGLTADDMKRGLRREMIVDKLVEREVGSKISITDQDIRDFYEKNRAQFNIAETQYRVAQIVITPVREPQIANRLKDDAASPVEAQRKLQLVTERLRGGADFASVAMDYSEDAQSAPQGGDLGFIPASALNQVPPQLRDVVLKSEPGNVSTVSAGGAHTLVLLVAREAAGQRELSTPSVRDGINDMLRQRKEQLLRTAYVAAARNDTRVVNHLARMVVEAQGRVPSLAPAAPGK